MPLNKARGNMYNWCTHTFNVIKGECPHQCSYCYCKRWGKQSPLHFDDKELKADLGSGNTIFVGSSCDMWADFIPMNWIEKTIRHCLQYEYNNFLFQSKNPGRFLELGDFFPESLLLGATIETNREYALISKAPKTEQRKEAIQELNYPFMVSIEPIMDFDFDVMVKWMQEIKPEFVSIGADSGNNHLPEPSGDKIKALIEGLKAITDVKVKDNLTRLLGQ